MIGPRVQIGDGRRFYLKQKYGWMFDKSLPRPYPQLGDERKFYLKQKYGWMLDKSIPRPYPHFVSDERKFYLLQKYAPIAEALQRFLKRYKTNKRKREIYEDARSMDDFWFRVPASREVLWEKIALNALALKPGREPDIDMIKSICNEFTLPNWFNETIDDAARLFGKNPFTADKEQLAKQNAPPPIPAPEELPGGAEAQQNKFFGLFQKERRGEYTLSDAEMSRIVNSDAMRRALLSCKVGGSAGEKCSFSFSNVKLVFDEAKEPELYFAYGSLAADLEAEGEWAGNMKVKISVKHSWEWKDVTRNDFEKFFKHASQRADHLYRSVKLNGLLVDENYSLSRKNEPAKTEPGGSLLMRLFTAFKSGAKLFRLTAADVSLVANSKSLSALMSVAAQASRRRRRRADRLADAAFRPGDDPELAAAFGELKANIVTIKSPSGEKTTMLDVYTFWGRADIDRNGLQPELDDPAGQGPANVQMKCQGLYQQNGAPWESAQATPAPQAAADNSAGKEPQKDPSARASRLSEAARNADAAYLKRNTEALLPQHPQNLRALLAPFASQEKNAGAIKDTDIQKALSELGINLSPEETAGAWTWERVQKALEKYLSGAAFQVAENKLIKKHLGTYQGKEKSRKKENNPDDTKKDAPKAEEPPQKKAAPKSVAEADLDGLTRSILTSFLNNSPHTLSQATMEALSQNAIVKRMVYVAFPESEWTKKINIEGSLNAAFSNVPTYFDPTYGRKWYSAFELAHVSFVSNGSVTQYNDQKDQGIAIRGELKIEKQWGWDDIKRNDLDKIPEIAAQEDVLRSRTVKVEGIYTSLFKFYSSEWKGLWNLKVRSAEPKELAGYKLFTDEKITPFQIYPLIEKEWTEMRGKDIVAVKPEIFTKFYPSGSGTEKIVVKIYSTITWYKDASLNTRPAKLTGECIIRPQKDGKISVETGFQIEGNTENYMYTNAIGTIQGNHLMVYVDAFVKDTSIVTKENSKPESTTYLMATVLIKREL